MSKIIPRQKLLSPSKYNLKCPWEYDPEKVTHIIVHNTANDASAEDEIAYMIRNDSSTSYHFAVDDKEVVQGVPLTKGTFSCGNRDGDVHGITIEICWSASGGERFAKAERLAARFIAQLLKERGWGLDKVTKHQDYDGKYCPHRTLDLGWQRFLNMIQQEMEEEKVTYEQWKEYQKRYEKEQAAKQTSKWAEPAVAYCMENGLMSGDKEGTFRPRAEITRQEVAQVAMNLHEKLKEKTA